MELLSRERTTNSCTNTFRMHSYAINDCGLPFLLGCFVFIECGCNYEMWRMRKQTVEVNSFHLMKKIEGVGDV